MWECNRPTLLLCVQYNTKENGIVGLNVDVSLVYGGILKQWNIEKLSSWNIGQNNIIYFYEYYPFIYFNSYFWNIVVLKNWVLFQNRIVKIL